MNMNKEQILRYVPKSKQIAIREAWQDSDGIWIMLREGWNADRMDYPCRTIHEDTIQGLRYQIAGINRTGQFRPGDTVEVHDNGRLRTHITPRWAYGMSGKVVRLNDLSVSVRLTSCYTNELIRVNYEDLKPL